MSAFLLAVLLFSVEAIHGDSESCTQDGKTFKVGEQYDVEGYCQLNVCKGNNEWTKLPCGLVGIPVGWSTQIEDPTKPYPECCAKAVPPLDIVPDVLPSLAASDYLHVTYGGGLQVNMGNELTPSQVKNQPIIQYDHADQKTWYLLCMVDPDAPSRKNPESREFLHCLVGNIPGNDVNSGDILAEYVEPAPLEGTFLHRYVFLLYEQPEKLVFDEVRIPSTSSENRKHFSIWNFAQKYKLGDPVALNVFQAQYEEPTSSS